MSIVIGKEAVLREANIAAEQAAHALQRAVFESSKASPQYDAVASQSLLALATGARELCCLARLALLHLTEKP